MNAKSNGGTPIVMDIRHLKKTFTSKRGPVEAVKDITFGVAKGTVVGLLGPSGAGKTTTLRMLTTLLPIDSGEVFITGIEAAKQPAEVRQRIGYVSQLGGADDYLTARENLLASMAYPAPRPNDGATH